APTGAGTYRASASYAGDANHLSSDGEPVAFSIGQRSITVSADAKSKTVGAADPVLTYQITAGSLVGGDAFSGGLTRHPGEAAGTYAIRQGSLTAGSNYALTYVGAALTIGNTQATVALTATTPVSVPGQPVTFTATVTAGAGSGTPTGTITFLDGAMVLAT